MAVYLDDETVDLTGDSLADVLAAARAQLKPDGRMIVEVQLDGQALAGDQLDEKAKTLLSGDYELRLYSAAPAQLSRQVLEQVRQQLLDQQQNLADAAEQLQQDKLPQAFEKIGQINSVWITTVQAVEQAAAITGMDLANLTVEDKPFTHYTDTLFSSLNQLKQQMQDQDTASLADALAYEWPGVIQQWDTVLGILIDQIPSPEVS